MISRPTPGRRASWRSRALGVPLLVSAAIVATAAPVVAAESSTTLTPAGSHDGPAASQPLTPSGYKAGRYVVVLRDPAAAAYRGGIAGLKAAVPARGSFSARSARTREYVAHVTQRQQQVASSVGVTPLASYSLATNGFAADLSAKQASRLSTDPRVRQVVKSELLHLQDATTSTGYLGLEGEDGVWQGIGGPAQAGKGTVIGVVDTGIAPENPSFAGDPLGTTDGAAPYRDGSTIVFHKSDGTDFRGVCQTGQQFTADDCSQKIVGARYFVDGFGAGNIGDASIGEYTSPRDGTSHGSHTASTAAGDQDVATTGGPRISGVTPAAKIAVYKACWSGKNAASEADDGCASSDLLSAIDAAVADGVDVINYSIGGGAAETTNSLTDQAFMAAATAGIFVAAAGGNSGPDASTLDNAAPWETTVAASTFPAPEATVRLGNGDTVLGASVTVPSSGVAGRFVYGADVALPGAKQPALCTSGSLDPVKVAGAVVLCDRGVNPRVEKSAEVKRAGGIGMVLLNTTPDSTDVDEHSVPTVHVDAQYADRLHAYATSAGATVTLAAGNSSADPSVPTPQVAGFSSRGPVEADGSDIIKPDVAAPGVNVLAAYANAEGASPKWGYMSGTSMASPHVAGLAALYLGTKPDATPAEIKSALMTSATDTVDADGKPEQKPFAQGNGQVVPRHYLDPGLVYLNDVDDWNGYLAGIGESTLSDVSPIDGSDLNLASIGVGSLAGRQTVTRTVTATRPGTYTATVAGLDGVHATVEPSTLTFAEAGEQHTFTVTFLREDAPLGDFTTGYLTWSDGTTDVRSALAVRPVAFDAPTAVAGTGTTGSADIQVSVGDDADVPLVVEGLAHGSTVEGTGAVGGPTHRYAVTVPDGATFARFDLAAADKTGDLDLMVYREDDASSNVWFVDGSATDSADEHVDLVNPMSGTYVVEVVFYGAGQQGADLDYALTSYVVDPASGAGDLQVSPNPLQAAVGDRPTLTASWSDLVPGRYLGVVHFGDTGISTIVTVDAGTDTPAEPGTPTLTVSPDASGWVARTNDLRVRATGLTPGATYAATIDDGTVLRTGKAPASGEIDWMVTITGDVPLGPNTLTLTGAGASLQASFRVTPVKIAGASTFPWTAFNGKVFARLDISYAGYGDIRYRIQSAGGGQVFAEKTLHVTAFEGATTWSVTTPWYAVGDEPIEGVITPVMPDGSDGPSFTTDVGPQDDPIDPGTISFAPTAEDPHVVDVRTVNNSYTSYSTMVRYHGCDGRYVVAFGFIPVGTATQRWNLNGMVDLDVVDQFGQVLTSYHSKATGACDVSHVSISQDYWATLTATPRSAASYDPARPITMEVSNRYGPHSGGFNLRIGEGEQRFAQQPFYTDDIPTEVIQQRGPVISRSVTVREGAPVWASSDWEEFVDPPGILFLKTAWVLVPALTVKDLTPAATVTPVTGATPSVTGQPVVGSVLRATAGTWGPRGVRLGYQWLRDGHPIPHATGTAYRLVAADGGHRIAVTVTGSLAGATSVSRTSTAVSVLRRLTSTPRPRITGTAAVGHRLAVRTGRWEPGTVHVTVVWYRDGHRVSTGLHYTVRRADRHHRITVVATGRLAGYETVSRSSAARRVR